MDWPSLLVWGAVATSIMTVVEAFGVYFGLTRMSTPVILGTFVARDRDRAMFLGIGMHLLLGLLFAAGYAAVFEMIGGASWWRGALVGAGHELFMLGVVVPALPGVHPRMASESHGPDPTRALQPPGFLALNYGGRTLLVGLASHVLYGGVLGAFYGG